MTNPIVIGTDQNEISVTSIYFPAVTICTSLIFSTEFEQLIDYDAITKALNNHEIEIDNLTINELKYMQVIGMVYRDGFLSKYNVSIPTDDFIERLMDFPEFWRTENSIYDSNYPVVEDIRGNWSSRYTAK